MTDPPFGFGHPATRTGIPTSRMPVVVLARAAAARAVAPAARWDRSATRSSSQMPCASSPT